MSRWDNRKSSYERGYTHKWRAARLRFLRDHPICSYCYAKGYVKEATVVDHIVPHRGDTALFWDRSNWQALCKHCHDSVKQREELGTLSVEVLEDGSPVGLAHW